MTGRRVPLWVWLLVAAPWLAGLAWAASVVLTGEADREFVVQAPTTVAAIVGGSMVTALAAAAVVGWRYGGADDQTRPSAPPGPNAHPQRLQRRLDRDVAARLEMAQGRLGAVEAAAERGVLEPTDVAALQRARTEIDDLSTLFAELQTLSDLESRDTEPGPVDVGSVLADVVELVTASPGLGGRNLSGPRDTTTGPALGDRDLLLMALHKIVLSALVSSRPGDAITISVSGGGDVDVVVEVSDTGLGIPADEILLAADAHRGDVAGRNRGAALGLGLALARAAAERHGGTVRVRSREGLGTVVTVVLPAAPPGR